MAVLVESDLDPSSLLAVCRSIEVELGRDRSQENGRWQSRLIDLDIICIENDIVDLESLQVPHPEMHKRSFVIDPMLEIWPSWRHPILHQDVTEIAKRLADLP
jgi:2-amino-4-hydroxy-6-hydroxymethyldihydropteridine diphosphokinase